MNQHKITYYQHDIKFGKTTSNTRKKTFTEGNVMSTEFFHRKQIIT